jgi:hypothetical protein
MHSVARIEACAQRKHKSLIPDYAMRCNVIIALLPGVSRTPGYGEQES